MSLSTSVFYLCSGYAEVSFISIVQPFPLQLTDNYILDSPFFKPHPRICFFPLTLERLEGGERERNIGWLSPIHAPTEDRTHNLGMCLDWQSNLGPFGVRDEAQPTDPPSQGTQSVDVYTHTTKEKKSSSPLHSMGHAQQIVI